ncbi:MAG: hypothetical protein QW165_03715 [Candidatus Woesearchaeota archaeon]
MHKHNSMSKKGDMPGWAQFLGLILAVILLAFLIWLSIKSGRTGVESITEIQP